jgi:hypothetical protein
MIESAIASAPSMQSFIFLLSDIAALPLSHSVLRLKCQFKNSDGKVDGRRGHEHYSDCDGEFPGKFGLVHRSSRMPLKNGWRTLPAADFARYSISASSDGSTQMPRCAIFLA